MVFDPRFSRLNSWKVSFKAYYDRVGKLMECLGGNSFPEGVVIVDFVSLCMLLPDFEEYENFLEKEGSVAPISGKTIHVLRSWSFPHLFYFFKHLSRRGLRECVELCVVLLYVVLLLSLF